MKKIRKIHTLAGLFAGLIMTPFIAVTALAEAAEPEVVTFGRVETPFGKPLPETGWRLEVTESGFHDIELVPGKPATCLEDGYTDSYICPTCGITWIYSQTIKAPGAHLDEDGDNICDRCGEALKTPEEPETPVEPETPTEPEEPEEPGILVKPETPVTPEEPVVYEVLDGGNSTWEMGSGEDFVMRSAADISSFVDFEIDGVSVDKQFYSVTEGSTIVRVKASFLATLPEGTHTVTICSVDGKAETTLNIIDKAKKDKNDQDDNNNSNNNENNDNNNLEETAPQKETEAAEETIKETIKETTEAAEQKAPATGDANGAAAYAMLMAAALFLCTGIFSMKKLRK